MRASEPPANSPTNGDRAAVREPRARDAAGREELAVLARLVRRRIDTLFASLRTLWAVRTDKAQLAFRRRAQMIAFLGFAALAGGTLTIYGAHLTGVGLAGGIGVLFGERPWLGNLLTGLLLLGLTGGGLSFAMRRADRKSLARQKAKYERLRRSAQREAR